jgi:hypothetical protein
MQQAAAAAIEGAAAVKQLGRLKAVSIRSAFVCAGQFNSSSSNKQSLSGTEAASY